MKRIAMTFVLMGISACMSDAGGGVASHSCSTNSIAYRESSLNINYSDQARSPIAEILSQGESEYLRNVQKWVQLGGLDSQEIGSLWRSLVSGLLNGELPEILAVPGEPDLNSLRILTPRMLRHLKTCVSPNDPRFGHIANISLNTKVAPPNSYEG